MKFIKKINLLILKRYFDLGYGLTSYIKLPIQIFGIGGVIRGEFLNIFIMILCYGIFCYVFGWLWVKYKWYEADNEVSNIFNPFQKQVRRKLKIEKFK